MAALHWAHEDFRVSLLLEQMLLLKRRLAAVALPRLAEFRPLTRPGWDGETAGASEESNWPVANPRKRPPGHPARGRLCCRGRSPGSQVIVIVRSSQGHAASVT